MNTIKSLFLAASLLAVPAAYAVPSYPGLIPMTQPDGSTIMVRIEGDDHASVMFSEDGYLLTEKNRGYYYADVDASGSIVASKFLASTPADRSESVRNFLSSIDMNGRVLPAVRKLTDLTRSQALTRPMAPNGPSNAIGLFPKRNFPAFGKQKALVVLVEFTDQKFKLSNPSDYFHRMLNEDGFNEWGGQGSAAQWYRENSHGQFDPEFDVVGPVTLPGTMKDYGERVGTRNDKRAYMLPIDACKLIDDQVNFKDYDRDGDGYIDNVFIFYAGYGENSGGGGDTLWPHSWDLSYAAPLAEANGDGDITSYVFDGVRLEHYGCTNEWFALTDRPDGIGTFCHEFGHILGLPDLYNTVSQSASFTPDTYDVMDRGSYNNNSCTPPLFSAFERYALGWMEPRKLTKPQRLRLQPAQSNTACLIPTSKSGEFFLIENRQQTGWDAFIPGHGMLVWHIDYDQNAWYSNVVNNVADHQRVDIEEADNRPYPSNRAGDTFPGTAGVTDFTDYTQPSMRSWAGVNTGMPLTDIQETEDGYIIVTVNGGTNLIPAVTPQASDVHHTGFTLSWAPLEAANDYIVTITGPDGVVEAYNNFSNGPANSLEVAGLMPLTEYKVTVWAASDYDISDPSAELSVTTADSTFDNMRPVAEEPEVSTATTFIAKWQPMEDAVDYMLNVYFKEQGEANVSNLDFTDGIDNLPVGWLTNSEYAYTSSTNSGISAPALRFTAEQQYLQTPRYAAPVRSCNFWSRASKSNTASVIVTGNVDGIWVPITTIDVSNKSGGQIYEVTDIPAGVNQLRFTFTRSDEAASLALDDVNVMWGGEYVNVPTGYVDHLTGNVTEYAVDLSAFNATPAMAAAVRAGQETTTFFYTVKGVKADNTVSRPSAEKSVELEINTAAIETIGAAAASDLKVSVSGHTLLISGAAGAVTVANAAGSAVVTEASSFTVPAGGVYIVTDGLTARKVVVK
ncbi:MAG: M6 family metalloprotease domain-containing protein [Bacteroidales bacterium]|nr:M6 family metalloprotease domain-containing protein [Bacteroidales bacterium]